MRHQVGKNELILNKIQREFSMGARSRTYRAAAYSERLRGLALKGLRHGHSIATVALSAKISVAVIRNWIKKSDESDLAQEKPIELKLIHESEITQIAKPEFMARIRFRSGVKLSIPVSTLTQSLIEALNGGAHS